ncbi:hypothetical protein JIQ42_00225 [Leishmania sp. Namibia]|uniref:hypothetical protein n=1 Tax=Leishmania sp. Namibia TaxID=2802991 RepID=UPI001B7B2C21|nr:hypothetical protein JIQ42_00225 [Leishmania sp. Namibia]
MSSPLLHREPLQQPPLPSPSRWCVPHEEVEEHHQPTRRPSGGEALLGSLSLTRSTDSTVADLIHGSSGDGCHDGEWRLGYKCGSTKPSCVLFNGQGAGGAADEEADEMSAVREEEEACGSLGPASCSAETHAEHWLRHKRGKPEGEQERAGDAISARQQASSEPRRGIEVGSDDGTSPKAEAGANCNRSSTSLIPNDDSDMVACGHRDISIATRYRIGSGGENKGRRSGDTLRSSRRTPHHHSTVAAANQRTRHATQKDSPPRTSRKLVYSASGTMLSSTAAHDKVVASDPAETLATTPTISGSVHDGEDGKAAGLIVKRPVDAAVSRGTLAIPSVAASDILDAPPSMHSYSAALPSCSAPPTLSPQDADTSLSLSSAAHAKATSLRGSAAQKPGKTATMQEACRSAPPLCARSRFEVECTDAGVESAMREMEERLRRHSDHGVAVATSPMSDGGVASRGSTPSFRRSESENREGDRGNRMESRHTPSASLFSAPRDLTDDPADADTMKSARGDDLLVGQRFRKPATCDAESFDVQHGGHALRKEAAAPASAGYELFYSPLSPPEDRRAHVYELAKALREDGFRATFPRCSEGLLTSPAAEEHPLDGVEDVAPLCISYATGDTSLFLSEAILVSADVATLSSKNTPLPPLHREALAPHQQELMGAGLQVSYSNSGPGGRAEELRGCSELSGPPLVQSSAAEGMPRASPAEGIAAAAVAASELIWESSATPSRTPCSSRRQRPPPRMLCPPTPSPSPSPPRSIAMDAVFAAAANVEEREEMDADAKRQGFPEVAPGTEPQIRPQVCSATALLRQPVLGLCADRVRVEAADEGPRMATIAAANSTTSSLCRSPLRPSSSVPAIPADTAVSASALAAHTAASAGVHCDAKVSFISLSSSCHERAVEENDGAWRGLPGEVKNKEGALAEPRTAAVILASAGDAGRLLTLSPRCASSEPSQPRLNKCGHTFSRSAFRADSAPQQVGAAAVERARSVGCEGVTSCTASRGSTSPRNAAVIAAVPLAQHSSPGDDSPTLPVNATSFTHGEQSVGGMSPRLVPLEGCRGARWSGSNGSAARGYTEVESMADDVDDSAGGVVREQLISPRQPDSARKSPLPVAAEGEEHLHVQRTLLSFSAASPSPIRPPIRRASSQEWLLGEAPALLLCGSGDVGGCHHHGSESSDEDDEAHLRYDAETFAAAEPTVAAATCPTCQRETLSGVYDDGSDERDDDRKDTAVRTSVAEALHLAESKCAVLRVELTSATERAAVAEATARARESECAELHALVSRMQAELAAVQAAAEWATTKKRVDAEAQTAACTDSVGGVAAPALSSPNLPKRLANTTPSRQDGTELAEGAVWRHRHDIVAQELVTLKAHMAEQLAVLDRLGMQPPFSEERVCAAERRLRHVRVAHAPGAATKANHADEALSERSHTPTFAALVDGATALGPMAGSASSSATAKRMQARNSNMIATLLSQRKQHRHRAQRPVAAAGEATASGAMDSAATSCTLAPPAKCDDSAHRVSLLDDKENCGAA